MAFSIALAVVTIPAGDMQLQTDRDLHEVLNEPPERKGGMVHPAVDGPDPGSIDEALFDPPGDDELPR
jgi:hypothetical protein